MFTVAENNHMNHSGIHVAKITKLTLMYYSDTVFNLMSQRLFILYLMHNAHFVLKY